MVKINVSIVLVIVYGLLEILHFVFDYVLHVGYVVRCCRKNLIGIYCFVLLSFERKVNILQ